jgi:hypothetical protein
MPNAQCSMLNAQCPMLNAQCQMPNAECQMSNATNAINEECQLNAECHECRANAKCSTPAPLAFLAFIIRQSQQALPVAFIIS